MKKTILRAEILENKDYVQALRYLENGKEVWKAPRPDSDFESKLREEVNEIFCGRVYDELIDSCLSPRLQDLDHRFGVVTNYIDQEIDLTKEISNYSNSDKLNIFFGLEVLLHQQDRNKDASRHLRIRSNENGTSTICPIDNGFSLMFIDESKKDPSNDLDADFINNLLSSDFVSSRSDIDTICILIESMDLRRLVYDTVVHIVGTCSLSPTVRGFIFSYAERLVEYLEARRALIKDSLVNWWVIKRESIEKVEIPLNAVP